MNRAWEYLVVLAKTVGSKLTELCEVDRQNKRPTHSATER